MEVLLRAARKHDVRVLHGHLEHSRPKPWLRGARAAPRRTGPCVTAVRTPPEWQLLPRLDNPHAHVRAERLRGSQVRRPSRPNRCASPAGRARERSCYRLTITTGTISGSSFCSRSVGSAPCDRNVQVVPAARARSSIPRLTGTSTTVFSPRTCRAAVLAGHSFTSTTEPIPLQSAPK